MAHLDEYEDRQHAQITFQIDNTHADKVTKLTTAGPINRGYSNFCHEYDFYFIERRGKHIYIMSGYHE